VAAAERALLVVAAPRGVRVAGRVAVGLERASARRSTFTRLLGWDRLAMRAASKEGELGWALMARRPERGDTEPLGPSPTVGLAAS
jgi:hypothetical protein